MKIKIKVHPNSFKEKIEKIGDVWGVWLKEKPIEGKANLKLVNLLKKYFGKEVKIKSGFNSRNKIVKIKDEI